MGDKVNFTTTIESNHAVVTLEVPELDVEHESNLVLEVFPRECIFTAAPYHARILLEAVVKPGKAFPDKIDYEKNTVTFRIPLESIASSSESQQHTGFGYGFRQNYYGLLALETDKEIRMLSNPELYSFSDRIKLMHQAETEDFNDEHYGMDHIQFQIDKLGLQLECVASAPKLTDDQHYRIRVIVEETQRHADTYSSIKDHGPLLLGLIDILLAVCYDRLTNGNELNEANTHINIQRLSATLSYFVEFHSIDEVLRSFYRRSCTYPLYRNKDIAHASVRRMLHSASTFELRWWIKHELMFVYDAFKTTDCAIMNHYYIKDYIRYVELAMDEKLLTHYLKEVEQVLPELHEESLGFGEVETVQKLILEIMGVEESDSTDSDDSESGDEETDSCSSDANSVTSKDEDENPNENVLEKLMNLRLSG